ncbi:unnamed protein product [Ceutorhynchus assimilis]|uniref:Cytochrome P450 n=1 Tax=Ceutorhynchus assimilis TaxID=467358 RepID=A0A9N9MQH5_9CUCU|nr:unnamed protein product [Ceutorhynchus assimilis]
MLWWIFLLTALIVALWYRYHYKPYRYWQKLGVKQYTTPWIIFGDFWPMFLGRMNVIELMDKFYKIDSDARYVALYHLSIPSLLIRDPILLKQLLVKDFDHFTDHIDIAPSEDKDGLWTQNLFALRGKKWRDMRSVLSGTFTSSKIKFIYKLIEETSVNFVQHFTKTDKDLIEVELKDVFTKFTNDVIATTAFGIQINSLEEPNNEFYLMGKEATDFGGIVAVTKFFMTLLFPWICRQLKIGLFSQRVSDFFYNLIDENLKAREDQKIVRPDMLQILLQAQKKAPIEETDTIDTGFAVVKDNIPENVPFQITTKDIASQAVTFFIAGFDSVSSAMCFSCYELAVNPDIQKKLREEIKETMEKNDDKITYDSLLAMKYLDMVVTESLRKWPAIPATDRLCVKPYTIKATQPEEIDVTLLPGQSILIPFASTQLDPQYYPNPKKFDPERFSDENKSKIVPYTYMPFGVGPRGCIGSRLALLEVKSMIFHLLKNFEVVPTAKTPVPLKLSKMSMAVTVDGGFPMAFKRIEI